VAAALIRTLAQLGDALQLETLAEGIEDRVQLEILRREHCHYGQGFLFSRPLEASAVERLPQFQRLLDPAASNTLALAARAEAASASAPVRRVIEKETV
jgi:EAL domain-containing protein (putative c-di-GMP-specific phosphodiesterase class I)